MRTPRQKTAAAKNSRRLYEKLTRAGLRKVSLWVCRENEPLIARLRALDLRRPLTGDAIKRAMLGKATPAPASAKAEQAVLQFGDEEARDR
jgi:hypothetical protein